MNYEDLMSFFQQPKFKPQPEAATPQPEEIKVPPHKVVFDIPDLIVEVADREDIAEGKVDILTPFGWQPLNYNPETGEMK